MPLFKIYFNHNRQPWKCPDCNDVFEIPNARHSCPERRQHKERVKAWYRGMGAGFAAGLFVFVLLFAIMQRNLITTYMDLVSFMQSEMAMIDKVNEVILNSQHPTWGENPEPPRRAGR